LLSLLIVIVSGQTEEKLQNIIFDHAASTLINK